jgi:Ca2+-binding RTX toxin-like protein/ERCC4-related helicase
LNGAQRDAPTPISGVHTEEVLGRAASPVPYTKVQGSFFAHQITLEGLGEDAFAQSLSAARVDMNPHQVDAALFALSSPLTKGVLLADEVGLGKTIEAALVIAQKWAERHRRVLLIVPASLRKQWSQELADKFSLPSLILEAKVYNDAKRRGVARPFAHEGKIIVTSYEFAATKADDVKHGQWDLVVFDEAHRLRNVHKHGTALRAKTLRDATRPFFKVLLTATPLQNSLMELYGLVSVLDEHFFGDENSFRSTYASAGGTRNALLFLRKRLEPICKRTLRRQVQQAGLIRYTERCPLTLQFEPSQDEMHLYTSVSSYLQRPDTIAFGERPNALVTLVIRKILGSSTFAVAETLAKIVDRLKARQRPSIETLVDYDVIEETAEELNNGEAAIGEPEAPIDPKKLNDEIAELEGYRELALKIGQNAKGFELVKALPRALDEIASKGGERKAVIFTESVRTQKYIADLLSANGYTEDIVLLNGQNNDPASKRIYEDWMGRHEGTEAISGSRTADMKAAIVDAFRNNRSILIATESGAEGINLQFCSLLINFDLPWNPQRVEQRIGRCHRYGQKIDVTVVNFLNLKNRAEQRVYELLSEKFSLFKGVFGASDEVLGVIERGVDIERRILEIVQSARNETDINIAFDRLQEDLQAQISEQVLDARKRLLETVDERVVAQLKTRQGEILRHMSAFDRQLLLVARAELDGIRFYADDERRFDWNESTYTTEWPLADKRGWRFFRLTEGTLATETVNAAKARTYPALAHLRFDLSAYSGGRLADVEPLRGKAGWLRVAKLRIATPALTREQLVLSALTDEGGEVHPEIAERLLRVPAVERGVALAAFMHEIGHNLGGLKHGHVVQEGHGVEFPKLPFNHDSQEYSVMTYNSYPGHQTAMSQFPETPMLDDIAALQYLYGANYSTNDTDTVYSFDPATGEMFVNGAGQGLPADNHILLTIWDGGGDDSYDFSNYSTDVTVNLGAGEWINLGTQLANLDENNLDHFARGNIANPYEFEGNPASLIENATTGNGNDTVTGNDLDNVLDGGAGADVMAGGAGNDTYSVDNGIDQVVENANDGIDTVNASIHFALTPNVENLVLQGSADLQGYGNDLANTITGNSGSNLLDGGAGADAMAGGPGNDVYFVDGGDAVIENANEGNDAVFSTTHYALPANVETLVLQGSADLQGYGNDLANALYGNAGDNFLDGGAGADSMSGGAGDDVYVVDGGDGVVENANEGTDAVFSTINYVLPANVETLVLQGSADLQGYGNNLADAVYGNAGNNLLDGRGGADIMFGGAGNDVYFVDGGDGVVENANEGTDAVFSTINYALPANVETLVLQGSADLQGYGNGLANALYGNTGNNLLDGGGGAALLTGGAGNDTFLFRPGEGNGDTIVDFDGQGAAPGDALLFLGFGPGATFTNINANQWQLRRELARHHRVHEWGRDRSDRLRVRVRWRIKKPEQIDLMLFKRRLSSLPT